MILFTSTNIILMYSNSYRRKRFGYATHFTIGDVIVETTFSQKKDMAGLGIKSSTDSIRLNIFNFVVSLP